MRFTASGKKTLRIKTSLLACNLSGAFAAMLPKNRPRAGFCVVRKMNAGDRRLLATPCRVARRPRQAANRARAANCLISITPPTVSAAR